MHRALGPQFLESHVPPQVVVVSQPNTTDAASRVQAQPAIALRLHWNVVGGRKLRLRCEWPSRESALDVVVGKGGKRAFDVVIKGGEARVDIAAVLLEPPLQQILKMDAVGRLNPASLNEEIRETFVLPSSPEQARLNKLRRVNQIRLQSEHTKQKVAVRIHDS